MSNAFTVLSQHLSSAWVCEPFMGCLPSKLTSQHRCTRRMKTGLLPAHWPEPRSNLPATESTWCEEQVFQVPSVRPAWVQVCWDLGVCQDSQTESARPPGSKLVTCTLYCHNTKENVGLIFFVLQSPHTESQIWAHEAGHLLLPRSSRSW
jgi:hypothetical protein